MNNTKNIPEPLQSKMPGYTAECALPPQSIVSSIGYTGIRYYSKTPEDHNNKESAQ